jgi:transmembrane sensor
MKNTDDSIWVLLQDDRLIRWILSPDDEQVIAYWQQWMTDHPDQVQTLLKAREIARDLTYAEKPANLELLKESIWSGIKDELSPMHQVLGQSIQSGRPPSATPGLFSGGRKRVSWYWAAAAAVFGLFLASGIAHFNSTGDKLAVEEPHVTNLLVREDLDRVNQTNRSQVVYLVDGSKITLQPGAGIRHAAFLQKDKREIYLEGNAFFDVAKDPRRPFVVYSGDLVVRVLGTSFKVSTNKSNGDITVRVKTGRIAVSKKSGTSAQQLILASNQAALYKGHTRDLVGLEDERKAVDSEEAPPAPPVSFVFEEAPVENIFETLEKAYGIPFYYDKNTFSHCVVTSNLTDETLEEKLQIICTAIGATYQVKDNGVFLDGKPCK